MSRIATKFKDIRREGRKGFIPFVSAGDPDLPRSLDIVLDLAKNGADIIELGVPFSDPMADGPTIQMSSQRALKSGMTVSNVLEMTRELRTSTDVPIVLFSYLNPLCRYGLERFAKEAMRAGVDGVLITDVVDGEASEIASILTDQNIDMISLIAPTTTDERLARIAMTSSGFIYAVSRTGVTGTREDTSDSAETLVKRARRYTDLPIAVGFGISTPGQITDVWRYADAAVVGSAIVAEIERSLGATNSVERVRKFVSRLIPRQHELGGE